MYVIMYHYVREIQNSRYPGIKGLELSLFMQQIHFLEEEGFRFVSLADVLSGECADDRSVLLTFDDGYSDHYQNVFPILTEHHIPGVFSMPGKIIREKKVLDVNKIHFILQGNSVEVIKQKLFDRLDYYRGSEYDIPSNQELYDKCAKANRFDDKDTIFVKRMLQAELSERLRNVITDELFGEFVTKDEAAFVSELYINMEQIREMKSKGMEFALHGYEHYWMNRLPDEKLESDIEMALQVFDGIVPHDNWCFCYPYGSYSESVIETAKKKGCTSGLTVDVARYDPGSMSVYKIPRLDTNDFPPKSKNYKGI